MLSIVEEHKQHKLLWLYRLYLFLRMYLAVALYFGYQYNTSAGIVHYMSVSPEHVPKPLMYWLVLERSYHPCA